MSETGTTPQKQIVRSNKLKNLEEAQKTFEAELVAMGELPTGFLAAASRLKDAQAEAIEFCNPFVKDDNGKYSLLIMVRAEQAQAIVTFSQNLFGWVTSLGPSSSKRGEDQLQSDLIIAMSDLDGITHVSANWGVMDLRIGFLGGKTEPTDRNIIKTNIEQAIAEVLHKHDFDDFSFFT